MDTKSENEFDNKCNHCNENCDDNLALKLHLEQVHGMSFDEKNSEKRAIKQENKNDKSKMRCTKKRKCERSDCPKIHIPEKNFGCEQCDGRFYNFRSKTRHINKEHKRKRYHCQKCDKAYAKKRSLTQHDKFM